MIWKDFYLVFSPKWENPGNSQFFNNSIPKVVRWHTKNALQPAYPCTSKSSIMWFLWVLPGGQKWPSCWRIFTARSISGWSMNLKIVAESMGLNFREVVAAASTKPFGFTPFYPGPWWPLHTHWYLLPYLEGQGIWGHTRFIELAGEINKNMPHYLIG